MDRLFDIYPHDRAPFKAYLMASGIDENISDGIINQLNDGTASITLITMFKDYKREKEGRTLKMDGYLALAESIRKLADKGKIDREQADSKIKVYNFLGTCTDEDICNLFDSSAFNNILKSYVEKAANELVDEKTISADQAKSIRDRVEFLLDLCQAAELTL